MSSNRFKIRTSITGIVLATTLIAGIFYSLIKNSKGLDDINKNLDSSYEEINNTLDRGYLKVHSSLSKLESRLDSGFISINKELDSSYNSLSNHLDSLTNDLINKIDKIEFPNIENFTVQAKNMGLSESELRNVQRYLKAYNNHVEQYNKKYPTNL